MMGTDLKGTNLVGLSKCADEMTYVDGGAYMTNEDCEKFILALGLTIFSNPAAVATAISGLGSIGASAFASIPVVGWIVGIVGVGYLTSRLRILQNHYVEHWQAVRVYIYHFVCISVRPQWNSTQCTYIILCNNEC